MDLEIGDFLGHHCSTYQFINYPSNSSNTVKKIIDVLIPLLALNVIPIITYDECQCFRFYFERSVNSQHY